VSKAGIRWKLCPVLLAAYWLTLSVTLPLSASSLWHEGAGSLYSALPRTWKVGDLITVIIVEQAQATQTAGTETQKKSGVGVGVDFPFDSSGQLKADVEGGDRLRSTGKTVRGGTLRASLTAEVKALEPSGNLRIEGRQTIVVNGETQEIVLSGIVRPEDISRDNTVLSTSVAEAEIAYQGAGSLGAKQRQGIITRFFHWLF